jgi:hypothetical protein
MGKPAVVCIALAVAACALFALHAGARASDTTCSAFVGGLQTSKTLDPQLVVFNTTDSAMTLDLKVRAPDSTVLADLPGSLVLGARQTIVFDLRPALAHAGPTGKAYVGTCSIEVSGAAPFSQDTAVVHVTQYVGAPAKPKAAYVVRSIFSPPPPV